jgi:hypothetical protein
MTVHIQGPVAMCVIRVDEGPGGMRRAVVSISPDLRRPGDVRRVQHRSLDQITAEVRAFLTEAGIDGDA